MIKFKHLIFGSALVATLYSCGGGDSTSEIDNFDHVAQALKDNDSLVSFLKKHYYNAEIDSVKPLEVGKTSLFDDVNLYSQDITETFGDNDVDLKLYYYVANEGANLDKGKPSVVDSVYVDYAVQRIVTTDSLSINTDSGKNQWFVLGAGLIKGWSYGFSKFNGGNNITNNGPITYENSGKGVLFIPSGLAYANVGRGSILPNEPLMFYIDLHDFVKDTDIDQDGIPSILEDLNEDGKPWNDDTDGDGLANFIDTDDDGDLVLTKHEDTKIKDGNPRNDFSDPNNPNLPDYLNPLIRKSIQ